MRKLSILAAPLLILTLTASCTPKIDTSSETSFVTSYGRMRLSLDQNERSKLDAALLKVAFKDVRDAQPMDVLKHLDQIYPNAKAAVAGKTAKQIMAEGR